eukprot:3350925-Karenia_brevis.AAC.1
MMMMMTVMLMMILRRLATRGIRGPRVHQLKNVVDFWAIPCRHSFCLIRDKSNMDAWLHLEAHAEMEKSDANDDGAADDDNDDDDV